MKIINRFSLVNISRIALEAGARDYLHVDISIVPVPLAQVLHGCCHQFHSITGITQNTGTEEEPLYIITTVKSYRQI